MKRFFKMHRCIKLKEILALEFKIIEICVQCIGKPSPRFLHSGPNPTAISSHTFPPGQYLSPALVTSSGDNRAVYSLLAV